MLLSNPGRYHLCFYLGRRSLPIDEQFRLAGFGMNAFEVPILLNSLCTSSLDIVRCSTQSLLLWADSSSFSKFRSAGFSLTKNELKSSLNALALSWADVRVVPQYSLYQGDV